MGFNTRPERRDLAVRLGAVDAAYAPDQVAEARSTFGGGAHVAIDCSGSEPGRGTAITVVRAGGRVVLHPEVIVSDTFPITEADAAYQLADTGRSARSPSPHDAASRTS